MERIIDAMSSEERRAPECIDAARRQHIADHSGSQTDEVERVIRQFMKFQSQMQQINEMTVWQRIKSLFGWSKPPGVG
jgi:signal recognition particle subunit SRP54